MVKCFPLISVSIPLLIGMLDSRLTEEYSWLEVSFWMTKALSCSVINYADVETRKTYISCGVTSCDW